VKKVTKAPKKIRVRTDSPRNQAGDPTALVLDEEN
jgi:hypothetical protein